MRSIVDELNITITEICVGNDEDSITFRAEAGHWQDAEFTLQRGNGGWTLEVTRVSDRYRARLMESEPKLACRFEDAGLGTIRLRI